MDPIHDPDQTYRTTFHYASLGATTTAGAGVGVFAAYHLSGGNPYAKTAAGILGAGLGYLFAQESLDAVQG